MIADFGPTGTPPMIGRKLTIPEWIGYIASYQFGPVMPSKVIVHHTWRPTVAQWQGLRSMQGMQRYFSTMGWTAAPHFFAAPDGIWLFTPMRELGVHAGQGNGNFSKGWYTLGLEMVGDYDVNRPSGAVWENTTAIIGGLALRLGMKPAQLIGFHRDYSTKTCPGKAVTLDWVIPEIEQWLRVNPALPAIKPFSIGTPAPETQHLQKQLMSQAWQMRGNDFSSYEPFYQAALEQRIGLPVAKASTATYNGKTYTILPFAQDTLYMEVPGWSRPASMWQTIGTTVPAEKTFERFLLDETLRAGGTSFRPDNPFHLFLFANRFIGPPLAPAAMRDIGGVMYVYQVFAGNTVYVRGDDPTKVDWKKMAIVSDLGGMIDSWAVTLRDTLLAETYRAMKVTYAPDQQMHILSRQWALGSPLGPSSPLKIGDTQYVYQVYADDVLFSKAPEWNIVHRLGTLMASAQRRNPVGAL